MNSLCRRASSYYIVECTNNGLRIVAALAAQFSGSWRLPRSSVTQPEVVSLLVVPRPARRRPHRTAAVTKHQWKGKGKKFQRCTSWLRNTAQLSYRICVIVYAPTYMPPPMPTPMYASTKWSMLEPFLACYMKVLTILPLPKAFLYWWMIDRGLRK